MLARSLVVVFAFLIIGGCRSSRKIEKLYSLEDKTVFELIERLNKDSNDKQAAQMLPSAYDIALLKRRDKIIAKKKGNPGDRWIAIAREREVTQRMHKAIQSSAAANKVIPDPKDPSKGIMKAKHMAAAEYYEHGLEYMVLITEKMR